MASSNINITLLFILPLIIATVDSAALHRYRRQVNECNFTPLGLMIRQFYCTSDSLKNFAIKMVKVSTQWLFLIFPVATYCYIIKTYIYRIIVLLHFLLKMMSNQTINKTSIKHCNNLTSRVKHSQLQWPSNISCSIQYSVAPTVLMAVMEPKLQVKKVLEN